MERKNPKPKQDVTWRELLEQIAENGRQKKLLEEWKPRLTEEIAYLPHTGDSSQLPVGTPERAVAEFVENWISQRYGLIAGSLLYFTDISLGKKSGRAKEGFGRHVPVAYKVISIEDQAAAVSHVEVELQFEDENGRITKRASVRAIYQDKNNSPIVRTEKGGSWRIVQNSFTEILYAVRL
jgi:hypothetical protein